MINQKNLYNKYRTYNLGKTLEQVDYIVLSPGISLIKNKLLRKKKKNNYGYRFILFNKQQIENYSCYWHKW